MCTLSIFRYFKSMIGPQNFTLTMPHSGVVCHKWAGTCKGQPKFEFLLHQLQRCEKQRKMYKMGLFGVLRDHSKALEIAQFSAVHMNSYYTSTVTMSHCQYLSPSLQHHCHRECSINATAMTYFAIQISIMLFMSTSFKRVILSHSKDKGKGRILI